MTLGFTRFVASSVSMALLLASTGCSIVMPHTQVLQVIPSEPDAQVSVNGSVIGRGNVSTRVKRSKDVAIMVQKPGYEPATHTVHTTLGKVGWLDLVAGYFLLIPLFGLLSPGAYHLEEEHVNVVLHKEQ